MNRHSRPSRQVALISAFAAVTLALAGGGVSPAQATMPSATSPSVLVWQNDFNTTTTPEPIEDYTNTDTTTTPPSNGDADTNAISPYWKSTEGSCNGWILNGLSDPPADPNCTKTPSPTAWMYLQGLAKAITAAQAGVAGGTLTGAVNAQTTTVTDGPTDLSAYTYNNVVAAYTNGAGAATATTGARDNGTGNNVQYQTANYVAVTPGQYYYVSLWSAATNCWSNQPLEQLSLIDPATDKPFYDANRVLTTTPNLDPCTASGATAYAGKAAVDSTGTVFPILVANLQSVAFLIPPASDFDPSDVNADGTVNIYIQVANGQTSGNGNDAAFDLPQLYGSANPTLYKSFYPTAIDVGGQSVLTFVVQNTSDGLAKNGWSFTDTLPSQVTVDPSTDGPVTTTTTADPAVAALDSGKGYPACTNTTVTNAGGTLTISGDLPAGPGCTVSVPVTSDADSTSNTPPSPHSAGSWPNTVTADGAVGMVVADAYGNPTAWDDLTVYSPDLKLTKSASPETTATTPAPMKAGDTVTYTYVVDNDGTAPLSDLQVNETAATETTPGFTGTGGLPVVSSCTPVDIGDTLAAGSSTTCTATYTVTQADVDNGEIDNTATAQGQSPALNPDGTPVAPTTSTDSANVYIAPAPALQLYKTASRVEADTTTPVTDPNEDLALGQIVTYSFEVTNTGNVPLDNVTVVDPQDTFTGDPDYLSPIDCSAVPSPLMPQGDPASPAANSSGTCTATYTVQQSDLDADGPLTNYAHATGTTPSTVLRGPDVTVPSNTDHANVPDEPAPALTVDKTADRNADTNPVTAAGQTVNYTFTVTNTGNVTMSDIAIDDPMFTGANAPVCNPTTLAPQGNPASPAAGSSATCTAAYTVTQADMDAGVINNTATAQGMAPDATEPTMSDKPSSWKVSATQDPEITIDKSASPTTVSAADTPVTYSFLVTNTGNVTLTNIVVNDPMFTGASAPWCPVTTLAPNVSTTCTATYTVTQADIDSGGPIHNSATASGTDPTGATKTSGPSPFDVDVTQAPALTLTKSATRIDTNGAVVTDPNAPLKVNQKVTYGFTVTNTGNVTVSDISIAETAFTGSAGAPAATCPSAPLAPLASVKCESAVYTVTQADVNAGSISNTATASGTSPSGAPGDVPSNPSSVTLPSVAQPSLTVVKSASPSLVTVANTPVTYSFVVTNTGNVTLTSVAVADPMFAAGEVKCPVTLLDPGAVTTCTATHVVTQADIDAGVPIDNTANASGMAPGATSPTTTLTPGTAEVQVAQMPSLLLTKSASRTDENGAAITDPNAPLALGQNVTYGFTVTNTGNVTMDNIAIDDSGSFVDEATPGFSGSGAMPAVTCQTTSLAPGATTTCTADAAYAVTQTDVDNGVISNTATASGTAPGATESTPSNPSSVTLPSAPAPSLSIIKSASLTTATAAGQLIDYSFLVTNTGNVTMTDVGVTDSKVGAVTCDPSTLEPGEFVTCTSDSPYMVTQADIDAGGTIDNTATASGMAPDATTPTTSDPSSVQVPVTQNPQLTLVKSGTAVDANGVAIPGGAALTLGQKVTYSFVVTNTGNVTISGVTINDAGGYIDQSTPGFTGSAALAITCDPASPTLVPQGDPASPAAGSSATCTATYTVTQADVNAGAIKNTATAQGTGPGASAVAAVSNPSPVTLSTTTLPPPVTHPSLSLSKTVNQSTVSAAGTTLGYSFVVMNTGDVAVSGIAVNDPMVGAVKCPATTLAVGASMTCTASYTVTQANMDAGSIVNTATAAGVDPSGGAVDSNASSATVTVIQNPQLSLTKSAVQTTLPAAGQTIDFLFLVKNTGNVTVNNVAINDAMFPDAGAITCPVTTLVPGDSTTCTASYVVTNADVIAGSVVNTATAIGAGPSSSVVRGAPVASNQSKVTLGSLSAPTGGGVGSLTPMWPMFALVMAGALLLVIGYRRKVAPQATSQTGRHAA